MKRGAKFALGLSAVAVIMLLFLLPVVTVTVQANCKEVYPEGIICVPDNPSVPVSMTFASASASVMYAYLRIGAIQVPGPNYGQHQYCLVYGDPSTMCGRPWQLNVGYTSQGNTASGS
jgi:hypothetical protein